MADSTVTEDSNKRFRAIVVPHEPEGAGAANDAITLALLYFPGALVPAKSYVPLARSLQKILRSASVTLHVVIAAGHRGVGDLLRAGITPLRYSKNQFSICLAALRDQTSFTPTAGQLFIAGHSMGGLHAGMSAMHCQPPFDADLATEGGASSVQALSTCAGVILHGSYATAAYLGTPRHPPVATILGDRDGLVQLSHIATHRRDHVQPLCTETSAEFTRTPLVILPGVSHTSFTAGASTGYVRARDMRPTIPHNDATTSIAAATAAFILTTSCCPALPPPAFEPSAVHAGAAETPAAQHRARTAQSAAEFVARHHQRAAAHYLDPYSDALCRDLDGSTCMDAQRSLLLTAGTAVNACDRAPSDESRSKPDVAVEVPALMHEVLRALRAPLALRRDAFASATAEVEIGGLIPASGGEVMHVAGGACDTGVTVRPCAALTLRRRPGFRMSVPAAPTRLRCKLVVPVAESPSAGERSTSADLPQHEPPAADAAVAAAATLPAAVDEGALLHACGEAVDSASVDSVSVDSLAAPLQPQRVVSAVNAAAACKAHSIDVTVDDGMHAQAGAQATTGRTDTFVSAYAAAYMNKAIVERVLQKLPDHIQELYRSSPRRLVFGADADAPTLAQWLHAGLCFEEAPWGQAAGASAACAPSAVHAELSSSSSDDHSGSNGSVIGAVGAADGIGVGERVLCSDGDLGGHVVLRSPRYLGGEGDVLCCTLLSEAQAYEYVLYGSQRGEPCVGVEEGWLKRAPRQAAPVVEPVIWQFPPRTECDPLLE